MKFKVDPMKGDFNTALEVQRITFEDVIAPTCQVFLQLKHEDWSGKFVDIGDGYYSRQKRNSCCGGEAGVWVISEKWGCGTSLVIACCKVKLSVDVIIFSGTRIGISSS